MCCIEIVNFGTDKQMIKNIFGLINKQGGPNKYWERGGRLKNIQKLTSGGGGIYFGTQEYDFE